MSIFSLSILLFQCIMNQNDQFSPYANGYRTRCRSSGLSVCSRLLQSIRRLMDCGCHSLEDNDYMPWQLQCWLISEEAEGINLLSLEGNDVTAVPGPMSFWLDWSQVRAPTDSRSTSRGSIVNIILLSLNSVVRRLWTFGN